MSALAALAANTVRELARNKLLYVLLVFALALILGSVLLASLTIGQWERVINDVGLATVELSGALIAVLVGVGLLAGEVDRRTVYVTLAKPVTRARFVVGRYLGLCAMLVLLVAVMGGALTGVLRAAGFPMTFTGAAALLLICVELCLLAAFAVLFSSFTTTTLGTTFAVSVFAIGHMAGELATWAGKLKGPSASMLAVLARVVPNLQLLNLKTQAANQLPVSPGFVGLCALYGLLYSAVLLAVACLVFARRDLK